MGDGGHRGQGWKAQGTGTDSKGTGWKAHLQTAALPQVSACQNQCQNLPCHVGHEAPAAGSVLPPPQLGSEPRPLPGSRQRHRAGNNLGGGHGTWR